MREDKKTELFMKKICLLLGGIGIISISISTQFNFLIYLLTAILGLLGLFVLIGYEYLNMFQKE